MHHHERRLKPRGDAKILVIEDEPTILFAFEETIRKKGFEFISARDGNEGLAKAKELIPTLIITDVGLPQLNGFNLCSTLKNITATCHIPIIIVTAHTQRKAHELGELAGADAFIEKPFQLSELSDEIDRCLSKNPFCSLPAVP